MMEKNNFRFNLENIGAWWSPQFKWLTGRQFWSHFYYGSSLLGRMLEWPGAQQQDLCRWMARYRRRRSHWYARRSISGGMTGWNDQHWWHEGGPCWSWVGAIKTSCGSGMFLCGSGWFAGYNRAGGLSIYCFDWWRVWTDCFAWNNRLHVRQDWIVQDPGRCWSGRPNS